MRASSLAIVVALSTAIACGPPREVLRVGVGGAVRPAASATGSTLAADERHAWLWRVSGGPAAAPSYMLGTMHLGINFHDALPEPLDAALFDARSVVMEIDLREAERFFSTQVGEPLPRSQWLDRALGDPSWGHLVEELGGRAPPEFLRQIPPGVLANFLQQVRMAEVEALEEGREPARGVTSSTRLDRSIFRWALSAGTPIIPLETPEEAFAALAALPEGDALAALREIVDEPDAARLEARRLRDAYRSLDPVRIDEVITEAGPEFRALILQGRNRAWMPHLLPELEAGHAFVAVGCAHFVGEGSLIELLEAAGYVIEPVFGDGGLVPSDRDDHILIP